MKKLLLSLVLCMFLFSPVYCQEDPLGGNGTGGGTGGNTGGGSGNTGGGNGGLAGSSTIDITVFYTANSKNIVDSAGEYYNQLVSTTEPEWTMFGTQPPPINNWCTFTRKEVKIELGIKAGKDAIDRNDHLWMRISLLSNSNHTIAGIQVPTSGWYGDYEISSSRQDDINDIYDDFMTGSYRTKYNAVGAAKTVAFQKAAVYAVEMLNCKAFDVNGTSQERQDALNRLLDAANELRTACTNLHNAFNSAIYEGESLTEDMLDIAFNTGPTVNQVWGSLGCLYHYYLDCGYIDDNQYGDNQWAGWPWGTPPNQVPDPNWFQVYGLSDIPGIHPSTTGYPQWWSNL